MIPLVEPEPLALRAYIKELQARELKPGPLCLRCNFKLGIIVYCDECKGWTK